MPPLNKIVNSTISRIARRPGTFRLDRPYDNKEVDNRLRKYYKLTESGTKETVNRLSELEEFIKNMQNLVSPSAKPDLQF